MTIALALVLAAGPRLHLGPPSPKEARRVVTLAPSLSEIVLALGAGDRLVGVTRFDDDPRTQGVARVGGYNDPQPEAVLAVRPDLVLAEPAPANRAPVVALARLGIPVEALPLATVGDIEDAIAAIAAMLGASERGEALRRQLEDARARARFSAVNKARPKTLLVFGLDPLVVAGPGSFAGELLADAGGDNAAGPSDKPFFRMSAEAAVRAEPELVVLCGVEAPKDRPPLPGLGKARIVKLRSAALLHPGPRLPEALADLAAAMGR